jgi:SAM-dependent methyltransferase
MQGFDDPQRLSRLYSERFGEADEPGTVARHRTWEVLTQRWFPRFVSPQATVLEMGTGRGEFINSVRAGRRIAVDLNPDSKAWLDPEVEFHLTSVADVPLPDGEIDVIFSSNLVEHLGSADGLAAMLTECHRLLAPEGQLITLAPNVRYVGGQFWDYLDHTLPLTHVSFVEALALADFEPTLVIPRFLPYTSAGMKAPPPKWAIDAYVRMTPAWRVLGKQFFIVARKTRLETE